MGFCLFAGKKKKNTLFLWIKMFLHFPMFGSTEKLVNKKPFSKSMENNPKEEENIIRG
jgi:hypothetical protein